MNWSIVRALTVVLLALAPACGCAPRTRNGIRVLGDSFQVALPAAAGGIALGRRDDDGARQMAESAALTVGLTMGLKYLVHEERPSGGAHSFPSGHASIAFCSAEFLRKRYGWQYGLPAYLTAVFVAYSRVEARAHYPHDVAAGALIGVLSSYLFTRSAKAEPHHDGDLALGAGLAVLSGFLLARSYHGWRVDLASDGKSHALTLSREW